MLDHNRGAKHVVEACPAQERYLSRFYKDLLELVLGESRNGDRL